MGLGTQKNFLLPENRTYFGRFKRYQKNLKVLLSNYSAIKSDAGSIENARKARRRLGGGGGQLKKSQKKSKSISGILGWVLTFFDPKF